MKSNFILPVIVVAGLLFVNFPINQVKGQTTQSKTEKQQGVKYTCPNHPEVVQDHPGTCPKDGMKLVEKKDMPNGNKHSTNDSTKMMMQHDNNKMMHDSTAMKNGKMKM
jgi:hypothetical protein